MVIGKHSIPVMLQNMLFLKKIKVLLFFYELYHYYLLLTICY